MNQESITREIFYKHVRITAINNRVLNYHRHKDVSLGFSTTGHTAELRLFTLVYHLEDKLINIEFTWRPFLTRKKVFDLLAGPDSYYNKLLSPYNEFLHWFICLSLKYALIKLIFIINREKTMGVFLHLVQFMFKRLFTLKKCNFEITITLSTNAQTRRCLAP